MEGMVRDFPLGLLRNGLGLLRLCGTQDICPSTAWDYWALLIIAGPGTAAGWDRYLSVGPIIVQPTLSPLLESLSTS